MLFSKEFLKMSNWPEPTHSPGFNKDRLFRWKIDKTVVSLYNGNPCTVHTATHLYWNGPHVSAIGALRNSFFISEPATIELTKCWVHPDMLEVFYGIFSASGENPLIETANISKFHPIGSIILDSGSFLTYLTCRGYWQIRKYTCLTRD